MLQNFIVQIFGGAFSKAIPIGGDEFELLAQVAAEHGVPYSFARARVRDYVEGRMKPSQPTGLETNHYAPSPSPNSRQQHSALKITMADNPTPHRERPAKITERVNVRFWGLKRTCDFALQMSAFDPKRT